MIKRRKLIKNILITMVLYIVLIKANGLYFTPLGAHKDSEKTAHYGPSEIVHIEDFKKGKYILGRYGKWFSCNTVNKVLFIHWRHGNQVHGFENDLDKPLSYNWAYGSGFYKAFGIINDVAISRIEIILDNGDRFQQEDFYDNMFLIHWYDQENRDYNIDGIRAYDKDENIVFEDMRWSR